MLNISNCKYKPSIGYCGREDINITAMAGILNNLDIDLKIIEAKCNSNPNIENYCTLRFEVIDLDKKNNDVCSIFYYTDKVNFEISKILPNGSFGFLRYIFNTESGIGYLDNICSYITHNNTVKLINPSRVEIEEMKQYIQMLLYDIIWSFSSFFGCLPLSKTEIDGKLNLIGQLKLYEPLSVEDVKLLKQIILVCMKMVQDNKNMPCRWIKKKLFHELVGFQFDPDTVMNFYNSAKPSLEIYKSVAKQVIDIINLIDISEMIERSLIYRNASIFQCRPICISGISFNTKIRSTDLKIQRCLILYIQDFCGIYFIRYCEIEIFKFCDKSLLEMVLCLPQSNETIGISIKFYVDMNSYKIVIPFGECKNADSIRIIIKNALGDEICNRLVSIQDLINDF
ncbi:hypothetical protein NGRA_2234 [Nosema granulosis]|uniref:Uncharacterized protein n=1 Tax=Nosema granulosis TaxID=83296 RepID=A0A9P6H097_9MICR|nr:hypothetical protein NGRA_2234 [Nosema granulosis]